MALHVLIIKHFLFDEKVNACGHDYIGHCRMEKAVPHSLYSRKKYTV